MSFPEVLMPEVRGQWRGKGKSTALRQTGTNVMEMLRKICGFHCDDRLLFVSFSVWCCSRWAGFLSLTSLMSHFLTRRLLRTPCFSVAAFLPSLHCSGSTLSETPANVRAVVGRRSLPFFFFLELRGTGRPVEPLQ